MINKMNKILLLLLLFLSLAFLPAISIVGEIPERTTLETENRTPKEWTLMLYFCADTREHTVTTSIDNSGNFLHADMTETKSKLATTDLLAGSEADINVIALYDYPYTYWAPYGHAVIYDIKAVTAGGTSTVAEWGETNMGDEQTLSDFVSFCKSNYPADNYALVLSDHGRGYAGFCYDYHAPHPYWPYALGDCLTVPEVESALSGGNNVDLLVLDTCLGGSFEAAWQFVNEVDYMVAGETIQSGYALHHPREIAYALSRDTDMTPLELAQATFDGATDPTVLPSYYDWSSGSLYDLTKFDIATGLPSFMDIFSDFTDSLIDELNYNNTKIIFFHELRNQLETGGLESSESMMVDLYNFLEAIVEHEADFHYNETSDLASYLTEMLDPAPGGVLIDEWHHYSGYTHLHGFSLCLPDSYDMYHGFLYPNMYDDLKISTETQWGYFIGRLFPSYSFDRFRIPEMYHIFVHPLDPVTQLHIFFEEVIMEEPLHVGLNDDLFYEPGMGIEIGIEGAEFHDDLLFGNTFISIPAQSLQLARSKAKSDSTFKVVINASAVSSPSQEVNLTVKHIVNDEIAWEESLVETVEAGQILSCEVSTNDTMTDLVPEEEPTTTPPTTTSTSETRTGFIGPTFALIFSVTSLSVTVITIVIFRRKKKA